MAKFAVIFFILLVACGTQGQIVQNSLGRINSLLQSFQYRADVLRNTVDANVAEVQATIAEVSSYVQNSMTNAITEYQESTDEIVSEAGGRDVSSCTSLGVDVNSLSEQADSNLKSCVGEIQNELALRLESFQTSYDTFVQKLYDISESAAGCYENAWTYAWCMAKLARSTAIDTANDWINVSNDATNVITQINNMQLTSSSCLTGTFQKLLDEAQTSYTNMAACVETQDETSS